MDEVTEPVVYLPSRRVHAGDDEAQVELRSFKGRLTLLAFSSLDTLVTACGPEQPWVAMRIPDVHTLVEACGALPVLDPELVMAPS